MPTKPSIDIEPVLERLRSSGVRVTLARRAVVEALTELDDHSTAEDVQTFVMRRHPSIDRSTIYRTLESLEEAGLVNHFHSGQKAANYHLSAESHSHASCVECGAVVDISAKATAELARRLSSETGFLMNAQFAISGKCKGCASAR